MSSKTDNKNVKNGSERLQTSLESGTSLEQDQASVQKLQHLQAALKHLQVNRVKEKHERQTLSTLFQEEKESKDKLLQLNKKLTYTIQVLKKRLEDHGLSSSLDGKTDTTKPQTSKQLLSDLMRQNADLKQRLTECSNFDIPLKESQLQRIHDLEDRLEKELYEKNLLEERIRQLGTASNDEKDAKIFKLESEIERLKDNSNVQEVLSQSLMDEVVTVNRRLQDTAKTYQEVVVRLRGRNVDRTEPGEIDESLKSIEGRFPERRTDIDSHDGHDSENTGEENKKLKSENIKLKSELSEAVDVNKRWNSYNQQREVYVKKQQEKITQLEERLKRLQEPDGDAEDKKKLVAELDRLKLDHAKTCKTVKDLKAKLQIITEQKDVYQSRNRELMQSMENSPWYRELKDKVYHLQAQVQTITEDFQNERRDRELAQGRLAEVEVELAYYKRYEHAGGHYGGAVDLRSLEREQQSKYTPYGRCAAPALGGFAQQRTEIVSHSPGLAADNIPGSGSDNDSLQTNPDLSSGSSRGLAQALLHARSEEDIQCPRCHKFFKSGQHQQLLEHMDTCCD